MHECPSNHPFLSPREISAGAVPIFDAPLLYDFVIHAGWFGFSPAELMAQAAKRDYKEFIKQYL
jgi:hypothetical protein